jgi:hypothetical protein
MDELEHRRRLREAERRYLAAEADFKRAEGALEAAYGNLAAVFISHPVLTRSARCTAAPDEHSPPT